MVRTIRRYEDPEGAADRQTASLAGLAVTLALIVASLFLIEVLRTPPAPDAPMVAWRTG